MKNILFILTTLFFVVGCTKNSDLLNQNQSEMEGKSLAYWNPLPPQVVISNPVAKYITINGCSGYDWPHISTDTVQLKLSVIAGRKWDGSPDKLTKLRIVVDNVIVKEIPIATKIYSETYIVNIPVNGLYIPSFDQTKEWHSLGVTVWQSDGNLGSQALYYWTNP